MTMPTKTAQPPKLERTRDSHILWPSVEIEPTPELAEMSRRAVAARRAWKAIYDRTRDAPLARETFRALDAARSDQGRVLNSFRWELRAIVGRHQCTFWVDASGGNRSDMWFEGAQFVISGRFHWFVDGDRFAYAFDGERFTTPLK
jgi:hypothetical protein